MVLLIYHATSLWQNFHNICCLRPREFFIIIPLLIKLYNYNKNYYDFLLLLHSLTIIHAHIQMNTSGITSYFYKELCDLNLAPFLSQASLNSLCCFFKQRRFICFMHVSALRVCTHVHHVCA